VLQGREIHFELATEKEPRPRERDASARAASPPRRGGPPPPPYGPVPPHMYHPGPMGFAPPPQQFFDPGQAVPNYAAAGFIDAASMQPQWIGGPAVPAQHQFPGLQQQQHMVGAAWGPAHGGGRTPADKEARQFMVRAI
jgi:hypothetical protein